MLDITVRQADTKGDSKHTCKGLSADLFEEGRQD